MTRDVPLYRLSFASPCAKMRKRTGFARFGPSLPHQVLTAPGGTLFVALHCAIHPLSRHALS